MGDDDLTERLREKFWYRRADGSDKLAKEAADEIEQLRAAVEAATGWLAEDSPEWEMYAQTLYNDDAKFPPGTVGSLGRNDTERLTALTAINIDLRLRIAELEAENKGTSAGHALERIPYAVYCRECNIVHELNEGGTLIHSEECEYMSEAKRERSDRLPENWERDYVAFYDYDKYDRVFYWLIPAHPHPIPNVHYTLYIDQNEFGVA